MAKLLIALSLQLCDFGGAVQMMATIAMNSSAGGSDKLATTRAWTAPELFLGGAKTTFSDMYAFGVFMLELMTCMVPFDGVSPDLIGDLVMRGVRPSIPSPPPEGFPPPSSTSSWAACTTTPISAPRLSKCTTVCCTSTQLPGPASLFIFSARVQLPQHPSSHASCTPCKPV